jgi:polyhydroxyalkanoate synthesis regulator phasin
MAVKNGKSRDLHQFVIAQLQEAQKRFQTLENDAEKALKGLMARGKESRKDIQKLLNRRLNAGEVHFLDSANATVKQLGKRAEKAGTQMRKRLDELQARLVAASGMATQAQVKELRAEINRLAKKVDAVVGKAQKHDEVRA